MVPPLYRFRQIILFAGDLIVFELALIPTLLLRYGTVNGQNLGLHAPAFGFVAILWCMTFYINHLYELEAGAPLRLLRRYLESMIANLGIAIAVFYLFPFGIAPRTNLFLHFLISLILGYGWRVLFHRFVIETQKPVAFLYIGDPHLLRNAAQLLSHNRYNFALEAACFTPDIEISEDLKPVRILATTAGALEAIQSGAIKGIVMDRKASLHSTTRELARAGLFASIPILDMLDLEETLEGRIPLAQLSETWLLIHLQEAQKAVYNKIKRVIDILFSIPFGVLTIVLIPFIAILNRLSSPGPLFYGQERIGQLEKPFMLWKFRTMRTDAEANGPQFSGGATTDTRITKIGRWMRQLRIDELPQIWNVLRGDLSVIGPRPERPEFVEPLTRSEPAYALRHITRPGLTGWAQVTYLKPNERNEDNLVKLQYDLYYMKNRSLMLDGLILLKTIGIVLRRQGV